MFLDAESRRIAREHGDELVGEQGGPDCSPGAVDQADEPPERALHAAARALALEDLQREPRDETILDEPAGAVRQGGEAAPGEEAHVRRVEDAAMVVVEPPEPDAQPRIPVADVRDARD